MYSFSCSMRRVFSSRQTTLSSAGSTARPCNGTPAFEEPARDSSVAATKRTICRATSSSTMPRPGSFTAIRACSPFILAMAITVVHHGGHRFAQTIEAPHKVLAEAQYNFPLWLRVRERDRLTVCFHARSHGGGNVVLHQIRQRREKFLYGRAVPSQREDLFELF